MLQRTLPVLFKSWWQLDQTVDEGCVWLEGITCQWTVAFVVNSLMKRLLTLFIIKPVYLVLIPLLCALS